MSRGKVVAVGVFVALVSVTSAWAQTVSSTTGAINGKTVDESGAGVPGVTVTAASASPARTAAIECRRYRRAPTNSRSN